MFKKTFICEFNTDSKLKLGNKIFDSFSAIDKGSERDIQKVSMNQYMLQVTLALPDNGSPNSLSAELLFSFLASRLLLVSGLIIRLNKS